MLANDLPISDYAHDLWGGVADWLALRIAEWSLFDHRTGCLVWQRGTASYLGGNGYGSMQFLGRKRRVNRLVWMLFKGPIPDGKWILHSCDNPPCSNIAHLSAGEPWQNRVDMVLRGRARHNIRLLPEQVRQIRSLYATMPRGQDRQKALARQFGIAPRNICKIITGEAWGYLPQEPSDAGKHRDASNGE